MPESLAVRRAEMSNAITRVHEVLDAFAARDLNGETLTAIRYFPAREAQWAGFPAWVNSDLAAAYAAKGIHRLYTHQPPPLKPSTPGEIWSSSRQRQPEKRPGNTFRG